MAKFKIGDKVRIKPTLEINKKYSDITLLDGSMSKCRGMICTIEAIDSLNEAYRFKENPFWWGEEALEPAFSPFKIELDYDTMVSEAERIRNQIASDAGIALKNLGRDFSFISKIKKSEEEKMNYSLKFSTTEGCRVNKSNNTKVPTITTEAALVNVWGNKIVGRATCDKADYNERQGVLEAIANSVLGGNFDREYSKAVKANAFADKKDRTCKYCGKLFDAVEEKQAHEAWHVERKKARRERYLLRKRAKEIAFEEQAQKLAKEIIAGDNKK